MKKRIGKQAHRAATSFYHLSTHPTLNFFEVVTCAECGFILSRHLVREGIAAALAEANSACSGMAYVRCGYEIVAVWQWGRRQKMPGEIPAPQLEFPPALLAAAA